MSSPAGTKSATKKDLDLHPLIIFHAQLHNMTDTPSISVSTSTDKLSSRPIKKRALTPVSKQAASVEALFARPDIPIDLPTGPITKTLAPPPEIVTNVQGSSSGAGSGEFHVYKASRRREYERIRLMEEEVEKEKAQKEWEKQREEREMMDKKKTNKNKAKRDKARLRKEKAKDGATGKAGETHTKILPKNTPAKGHDYEQNVRGEVKAVDETPGILIHDEDEF